tara:strand:- start:121501 stop:122253 length:753 start_codon:yes stop_codon:yes gene_type:complete
MQKIIQLWGLGLLALGWVATGVAEEAPVDDTPPQTFVEGKHYMRASSDVLENDLVQELQKEGQDKVQVLEFFSYGCSWCYKLDIPVEAWVQNVPDYVAFQRVPVEFQPSWRTLSKAYYVAEDLNKLSEVHEPLFDAIHTDKLTSSSEDALREFFIKQGIDAETFDKTFDSFSVNSKHKWSNAIAQALKVTSVPSLFILGKDGVYFTSVRFAGSQQGVLDVADFLINKQQEAASKLESKPTVETDAQEAGE